ncbi:MAG TPA: CHAP domain-containing protein, partial [Ktedonobacteraceae bacterium]|nr:CHAP domain-containing protein [Ktedonobacteraceae bacterium]
MRFPLLYSKHSPSRRKGGALGLLLVALVLAGGMLAFSSVSPTRAFAAAASVDGNTIASIATSQIGKTCSDYYGCPDSGEWCADFAKWVWDRVGLDVSSLTAASASFYDYGTAHGTLSKDKSPQVGDAVVYGYNASTGWAAHVALVTRVDTTNHTIVSVGGNEGGGAGIVQQDGPYDWTVGGAPTGQTISGYIAPVGLTSSSSSPSNSGGVTSWGPNRLDFFGIGTSGAMYHEAWNGSDWSGWGSLGDTFSSPPAVASWGPNRLDVFALGTSGAMYHQAWNGSDWSGWGSLGGAFSSPPAVVSWGPNRLDVFALGTSGAMYHQAWNGSNWGGWESLGGTFSSPPAVASWGPNRLDVFALGTSGAMYHQAWNGSNWSGWGS